MGTTLHACVEVSYDAMPTFDLQAGWECVGTWEFGKDYVLMRCLDKVCSDGWPPGAVGFPEEREHDVFDYPQWCSGSVLQSLLEAPAEPLEYPERLRALCAAAAALETEARRVRVLFGRI